MVLACLALGGLPGFAAPQAQAGDTLKIGGVALKSMPAGAGVSDIRRTVDLNGDVPTASYVTGLTISGTMLARTRNGYWLPWSGREADMPDNGFAPVNGTLEFKIVKEQLPAAYLPLGVTIAYRTAAGLKFGSFEIYAP